MKRFACLFLALLYCWTLALPAVAETGLFIRPGTGSITSPVSGQTWVLDTTAKQLKFYNGSGWVSLTVGPYYDTATTAPTVSNDNTQGYRIGALWYDTVAKKTYIATDVSTGAAVWYEITNRISNVELNAGLLPKLHAVDLVTDYVASGLVGSPVASLTMTTPAGVAYVSGSRVSWAGGSFAYTASKDTYDYLQTNGTINHVAVNNGAGAPVGQTGLLVQIVVTNGSQVTGVTAQNAAPLIKVATATLSTQAVNKGQADGAYAPISITTSGVGNQVYASPNGSGGTLTARSLVDADMPIIGTAHGGLGSAFTATANAILVGDGSIVTKIAAPSAAGTSLQWNGSAFIWSATSLGSGAAYTVVGNNTSSTGANANVSLIPEMLPSEVSGFGGMMGTSATRPLLAIPETPTVTPQGTSGGTSYSYKIVARDLNSTGAATAGTTITAASAAGSTATGNATLSVSNFNRVTWTAVTGAKSYDVYRTAGGATQGKISTVTTTTLDDTGLAASGSAPTTHTWVGQYQHIGNYTTDAAVSCLRCRIQVRGTFQNDHTITVQQELQGGQGSGAVNAANGAQGAGIGAGSSGGGGNSISNPEGGGGGGFGGTGGNGGHDAASADRGGRGGASYDIINQLCGSSGAGGSTSASAAGGAGGNGGGGFYLGATGNITINGNITAIGQDAPATNTSSCASGGGGSGGGVDIRSLGTVTINAAKTISVAGGAGGDANSTLDAAGGGGAGGYVAIHGTTVTNSGTITLTGGAAGSGSAGTAATAGGTGTSLIESIVWPMRFAP